MKLIDTHAHIYDQAFDVDREQVISRAIEAGVERIFMPAINSESHLAMSNLCRVYPELCFPMMGLHPTSVNNNPDWERELELVERYLNEPSEFSVERFYAVGEVGLDLYWSRDWARQQMEAFERQIELSIEHKLPLVIHTRDAWSEMVEVLSRYRGRDLRGVMHSFSGSYVDYVAVKECGEFMFGIGGVSTYKNSEISQLLPRISLDDMVLETDCPYLTPVPFRGKRNESGYVKYICSAVAEITGREITEVARVTTNNAIRIFGD